MNMCESRLEEHFTAKREWQVGEGRGANECFSAIVSTRSGRGLFTAMAEPPRAGLDASQKLQVVVGNCFQKAVELILHARIMPLPPELNRGASNEWVRLRMRAARSRDLRPGRSAMCSHPVPCSRVRSSMSGLRSCCGCMTS